jgi:predicted ArsR family transcriptional regulator
MDGLTIAEIASSLGIAPDTAKRRLQTAGIKPSTYAGPTAIYAPEAIDAIREVRRRGRPAKAKE